MKTFKQSKFLFNNTLKKTFSSKSLSCLSNGIIWKHWICFGFRIASGEMLGKDQPIILNLVDIPDMEPKLKGVKMELEDCAFPLLHKINTTSNMNQGFKDADCILLVGSRPRTKREWKELIY